MAALGTIDGQVKAVIVLVVRPAGSHADQVEVASAAKGKGLTTQQMGQYMEDGAAAQRTGIVVVRPT